MKIVSYTALHYGADYLGWAIRSVIDHVDQHVILYCPHGSHGSRTDQPCPDTRDELYAIARVAAGDKLLWVDGEWSQENEQREGIYEYVSDADVILVVDSDEIWPQGIIQDTIRVHPLVNQRCIRIPMIHMWRSFWRAIIHDPAYPCRVIFPKTAHGENTISTTRCICHMGYAQRPAVVEYKQYTHGHRGEWRRDVDWYHDRFLNKEAISDLHPVGSEYWSYEKVNPLDYMPSWMAQHKYFSLDWID